MNCNIHLTYFTSKISPDDWLQWRKSGKITNDVYPYSALPVLRIVRDNPGGGSDEFVLAETSAIIAFLEEFLAPEGTPLLKDMSLEARATSQMIKEASLFFLAQVWQTSFDKDWLAPPTRDKLWRGLVTRYLRNTERALSVLQKHITVVPSQDEPLTGVSVAVTTAINFITDLFPSTKELLQEGAEYELCGKVWMAVRERARVVEYWKKNGVDKKPWTITAYGTADWIAQEAARFDQASQGSSKL